MPLWKITNTGPQKVNQTKFKKEKILEKELENWIVNDPSILNESLLLIGRQIIIPDVKDRLDLLALDQQGNAVIIELKRGSVKDPVDIQALRYASYISKWKFEDFEHTAKNFLGETENHDFNFNSIFESFCDEVGVMEAPDINEEQRIIIVGSDVRDRLGSVALWLRDHSVDIKIIEVNSYKDGDSVFIEPNVIVPVPVSKFESVGKSSSSSASPWIKNGKSWHLEKRCSSTSKDMLLKLIEIIENNFEVDGPHWNQKLYISFKINNFAWLNINTHSTQLVLRFLVKSNYFNIDEIAGALNLVKYDKEGTLSEKISLPNSISIIQKNDTSDRIIIRIKEDFNLESEEFLEFLQKAYDSFHK